MNCVSECQSLPFSNLYIIPPVVTPICSTKFSWDFEFSSYQLVAVSIVVVFFVCCRFSTSKVEENDSWYKHGIFTRSRVFWISTKWNASSWRAAVQNMTTKGSLMLFSKQLKKFMFLNLFSIWQSSQAWIHLRGKKTVALSDQCRWNGTRNEGRVPFYWRNKFQVLLCRRNSVCPLTHARSRVDW